MEWTITSLIFTVGLIILIQTQFSKINRKFKLAGYCGILSIPILITATAIVIFFSSWFNPTINHLSSLGVGGRISILFNSGLIVSGILIFLFSKGVWIYLNSFTGRIGALVLGINGITLSAIGIFPNTILLSTIHYLIAIAYFAFIPITLFFIGITFRRESSKIFGGTFIGGIVTIVIWIFPWRSNFIPGLISSIIFLVMTARIGLKLIKLKSLK